MTSSISVQPPSPFSLGPDAGMPSEWTDVVGGRSSGMVIKPTLSPAVSPAIDAAMLRALELARTADEAGEMLVDVVMLSPKGVVLVEAVNVYEAGHDPTAHAKICALCATGIALDDSHLSGYILVVVSKLCAMYTGATAPTRMA